MKTFLSYPLDISGPRPPAIPAPYLREFMSVDADGASVQELHVFSHTGTHIDTAAHVFENGAHITGFTPDELTYEKPLLIDLRLPDDSLIQAAHLAPYANAIRSADMLMLRLGTAVRRREDPLGYALHSPGLSMEAARFLADSAPRLRCLGLDVPSVSCIARLDETMAVHNLLLSLQKGRFVILEEMKLDEADHPWMTVTVHPWMVTGMHSGPCSVIAQRKDLHL